MTWSVADLALITNVHQHVVAVIELYFTIFLNIFDYENGFSLKVIYHGYSYHFHRINE